MFKKLTSAILTAILVMNLAGCDSIVRKFTRKKKAKPVRPMFYKGQEDEVTRPPLELYTTHYIYWKTWMNDLIKSAGVNKKQDKRAVNEAISNLLDMRKQLMGEKAEELDLYIEDVRRVTNKMLRQDLNQAWLNRLKQDLDKIKGRIVRKFHYKKVLDYIKKE